MSMVCPNCGKEYENKKFCTECGKKLIEKGNKAAEAEPKGAPEEENKEEPKEVLEKNAEKPIAADEVKVAEDKNLAGEEGAPPPEGVIDGTTEEKRTAPEPPKEEQGELEQAAEPKEKEPVIEKVAGTDGLLEKIGELEKLFEERIRFTDFEENSRKEMYSELQKYKAGLFSEMVKPLLREIIDIRESMLKTVDRYQKAEDKNAEKILDELKSYADDDILSLLENYGVEIYKSEPGDDFSAMKQRLRKPLVKAENETLQGKIAESLSSGYIYNGQTIYGEWVKRYIYEVVEQKEEQ